MFRKFILLSLILLIGCTRVSHDTIFAHIESLIESDSSQALAIIDSISILPKYINDDFSRVKIHYFRGYINHQEGLENEALKDALAAEYLLENSSYDSFWNGRVQFLIGMIYDKQNFYPEAVERFRRAAFHYRELGHKEYTLRALYYMAETFTYARQPDSAIYYLKRILNESGDDNRLHYDTQKALINAYSFQEHYDSALVVIRNMDCQTYPESQIRQIDFLKAEVFLNIGNVDSAASYIELATNFYPESSNYASTHYINARLESMHNNYRQAYNELLEAMTLNDSLIQAKDSKQLASIEQYFMRKQMQEERVKAAEKRRNIIVLAVTLGFICILLLFMMRRRRIKSRINTEQNMAIVVELCSELEHTIFNETLLKKQLKSINTTIHSTHSRIVSPDQTETLQELFRESFRTLDALSSQYFAMQGSPVQTKMSIKEFEKELNRLRGSKASTQILRTAYTCFNGILDELASELPTLSQVDILLLAYQILGFSPKTISLLLELTLANFYKKRARIKNRIASSHFYRKDEMLVLLN